MGLNPDWSSPTVCPRAQRSRRGEQSGAQTAQPLPGRPGRVTLPVPISTVSLTTAPTRDGYEIGCAHVRKLLLNGFWNTRGLSIFVTCCYSYFISGLASTSLWPNTDVRLLTLDRAFLQECGLWPLITLQMDEHPWLPLVTRCPMLSLCRESLLLGLWFASGPTRRF